MVSIKTSKQICFFIMIFGVSIFASGLTFENIQDMINELQNEIDETVFAINDCKSNCDEIRARIDLLTELHKQQIGEYENMNHDSDIDRMERIISTTKNEIGNEVSNLYDNKRMLEMSIEKLKELNNTRFDLLRYQFRNLQN